MKAATRGGAQALLRGLDHHRRTVLDVLAVLLLVGGFLAMSLALIFLYPAGQHRLPGGDVLSAAGTSIAAGGILLGIGLPRDDHVPRRSERR